MTATPPTTAKSTPEAVRSANNFSNGEIISFADEFTALRQLASEHLHLVQQRQHSCGITRPTDDSADRLLHWLDLDVHGVKLSIFHWRGQRPKTCPNTAS